MAKKYKLQTGTFEVHYGGMFGCVVMPDRLMDYPHWKDEFYIWIDDRLTGKRKMNTLIHESIHASRPDMTEEQVEVLANDIEAVLWGEGWREKKPNKESK